MGQADAAVYIKHDDFRRMPLMHPVYPLPGQIGKRGEVLIGGQMVRAHKRPKGARSHGRAAWHCEPWP